MSDAPLITFGLAALNQERFIRQAVESAFAQTYSPLEIVLSDDGSEDATFEIIKEMAGAYRGPHRLILNQNPVRRSIGGHVNRIVEISSGELIITAAGDDISLPDRTLRTVEAWEASNRQATSIHSRIFQIDENGNPIKEIFKDLCASAEGRFVEQKTTACEYVRTLEPLVYGCANSFARSLFRQFGGLREAIIHEDNALALRSVLAGRMILINEPLVKYRVHDTNISINGQRRFTDLKSLARQEDRWVRQLKNRQIMYESFRPDLEQAKDAGLISPPEFGDAAAHCDRMADRLSLMREFLTSGFIGKCKLITRLNRLGLGKTELKTLRNRFLPRPLLLRVQLLRNYAAFASGMRNRNSRLA